MKITERDVRKRLRAACDEQTADTLARTLGVSPEFLSMVQHGKRKPSRKILDYLHLRKVVAVRYVATKAK
jgi:hypothetical protein